MPKSFLVKRVQKVDTAFFPWNSAILVPGYCLSYDVDKEFKKDGYEEEVKDEDVFTSNGCNINMSHQQHHENIESSYDCKSSPSSFNGISQDISKMQRNISEIKILKPHLEYNDDDSKTIIEDRYPNYPKQYRGNIEFCYDAGRDTRDSRTNSDDKEIIPSPIGPKNIFEPFATAQGITTGSSILPYYSPYYRHYPYQQHHQGLAKSGLAPMATNHYPLDSLENFRKHQCEFCFKWFKRSSSLSNHRMIHKNDKTFKCNQCNMCFLRKSDLGKHMVIHSGSKPYQCNVCGKRFSQSSNMLTHQRRHTGIRPYSCSICGKSFYRKVDVRRHASVHRNY